MPGATAAARIYAETLLELALDKNALDRMAGEVEILRAALRETPHLRAFLTSPRIEAAKKRAALRAALRDRLSEETLRFLEVVIDRDRQELLPEILQAFAARVSELRNEQLLEVASAIPLDEPLRERVRETFARATGRRIVLRERVDPELMGGMVAQIDDTRIDGSVRARLEGLRTRMLEAARAVVVGAPGA
jgi:F-type H+-transporting ATPase subunit delta